MLHMTLTCCFIKTEAVVICSNEGGEAANGIGKIKKRNDFFTSLFRSQVFHPLDKFMRDACRLEEKRLGVFYTIANFFQRSENFQPGRQTFG